MKAGKRWLIPVSAIAATAAVAAAAVRSAWERDQLAVEYTHIRSAKIQHPRTLVFLSDLHDKEFRPGNEQLLDAVRRQHPDAVLIGGDTMVAKPGRARLAVTARLLRGLKGLCPIYYAEGNHEQRLWEEAEIYGDLYVELRRLLRECGVICLADASACLDEDIRISGLKIAPCYYRNFSPSMMESDYLRRRLGAADRKRYQILLAHSPLFFRAYRNWGADLTLAGHFHGGTIRLPLLGGVMTPQYQFFLPCCAGHFRRGGRDLVVSRGLGTHSINIRLGNRPQVAVIKLLPVG
ncbi:MAG: metallophosphoesterase [Clostridiales bacterium]|nr:metallophosphoesterase [Clostridiales bacterium]